MRETEVPSLSLSLRNLETDRSRNSPGNLLDLTAFLDIFLSLLFFTCDALLPALSRRENRSEAIGKRVRAAFFNA